MRAAGDDGRTVQLRRYRIVGGELPAFVDWWRERVVPAREAHGFRVEFAFAVPENDEFVWAVSVEGDLDAFRAIDERYSSSEERRAAFAGVPQRIETATITIADRIA
jgi:hypothetical protein